MIRPQTVLGGRYRVGRSIGEGGMAIVYAGHDLQLGRDVAIKTLRPQFAADPGVRDRFAREARAAAALAHPNIVDVFDVSADSGEPYIVMELVSGLTLKQIIAEEAPFHPRDVAQLVSQVADALDFAHSQGYVHRDVKPGNIIIDDQHRVRVLDFGIAKGIADSDLTDAGGGFGTAGYISPEQAEGLMATPASDVYSLGVVAYEMLTGRPPFEANSPIALAMKHVQTNPPRLTSLVPEIPAGVESAVLRALEKNPTKRWSSAPAFAAALIRESATRRASQPRTGASHAASRPHGSAALTGIVAALVVGALATLIWFGLRPNQPSPEAELTVPTIKPAAPVITGGIETGVPELGLPTITADLSVTEPTAANPQVVPTIAPAGQTISVPNIQGLSIAEATRALLSRGLRIALGQPEVSDTVPMNAIVSQEPPAGADVQPGQIVRVRLSRGPGRGVETPP